MEEFKNYPPYLDYPKPREKETNGDRIRHMSDKTLAYFMATKLTDLYSIQMVDEGRPLTVTYINLMKETWFRVLMQWLRQPVEDE